MQPTPVYSQVNQDNSSPDRSPEILWHTQSPEKTCQILNTEPENGLDRQEVVQRLHQYGRNELQETGGRSSWEILGDQFKNVMLLMLIVVAIVSGILDVVDLQTGQAALGTVPFKDTIAILLIVILNGILGYLQESRAEKALAALKRLSAPQVRVIRSGKPLEVILVNPYYRPQREKCLILSGINFPRFPVADFGKPRSCAYFQKKKEVLPLWKT